MQRNAYLNEYQTCRADLTTGASGIRDVPCATNIPCAGAGAPIPPCQRDIPALEQVPCHQQMARIRLVELSTRAQRWWLRRRPAGTLTSHGDQLVSLDSSLPILIDLGTIALLAVKSIAGSWGAYREQKWKPLLRSDKRQSKDLRRDYVSKNRNLAATR
jgi:hypothetical protein